MCRLADDTEPLLEQTEREGGVLGCARRIRDGLTALHLYKCYWGPQMDCRYLDIHSCRKRRLLPRISEARLSGNTLSEYYKIITLSAGQ